VPRLPRPRLPRPRLRRPRTPKPQSQQQPPSPPSFQWPASPPPASPSAPSRNPSPATAAPRRAGQALKRLGSVGRLPQAAGRGASEFWFGLSIYTRRRLALALGIVAVIALIWLAAVPALPCQAPGGETCAPADDAVHIVPEDALAYLHVNVDPDTDQYKDAADVAAGLPAITRQATGRLLSRLPGPNGGPPDFARDIEPWFGGEAALAIVPAGGGAAEEVQLLEAGDDDGARKFADSIASGKPRSSRYKGVEVSVDRRGLATALVGGFLAIGRESGVRDVIDTETGAGGAGSLAGDAAASAARDALPDKRLADAYLSEDGIARLVTNPRGPLATLASVIDPGASRGAALALVASDDGLEVDVRSELDPDRSKAHPGFFSAFPSFQQTLAASLPSDSLGYLGIGDPGKTLKSLLEQASAEEPGLAAAVGNLVQRVKQLGNVDLEKDLLPSLGGEAAFALEPTGGGGGGQKHGEKGGGGASHIAPPQPPPGAPTAPSPSPGALAGPQTPFLEFVGAGVDEDRAKQALARLQAPIAKGLNPSSSRQAPVFKDHRIGDLTAHSLRLSPTVDLTYAIADSTLVIATDPNGVDRLASGEGGLGGADLFEKATDGFSGSLATLGYLNLEGLIALGERAGLAEDPAYATFAPEIRKLDALGLAVRSSSGELATDVRLIVGEGSGTGGGGSPSD
jgi:hypothetical protein